MQRERLTVRNLGNNKDDLQIKRLLEAYEKIDMKNPDGFSNTDWGIEDILMAGDYKATIFINKNKPILAIDISTIHGENVTTSFFDIKIVKSMICTNEDFIALMISMGYLVDKVMDEYFKE